VLDFPEHQNLKKTKFLKQVKKQEYFVNCK
jgi:hypothetical protein